MNVHQWLIKHPTGIFNVTRPVSMESVLNVVDSTGLRVMLFPYEPPVVKKMADLHTSLNKDIQRIIELFREVKELRRKR